MHLASQNLLAWKICMTFVHIIVIGSTLLRLLHRWRTKRMWWDDYSAIIPLVIDVAFVIIMWLRFRNGVPSSTGPKLESVVYSTWFTTSICITIIWGSRFSLSLSVARIFPEKHICRRFAFGLSFAVSLSYVASVTVASLTCKSGNESLQDLNYKCLKAHGRTIGFSFAVILDIITEILLIVTPLAMLWKVKLPTKERRLILALFSSNLISLISLIVFGTIWYVSDEGPDIVILVSMLQLLQSAINLLICNLLVVTMLLYRIFVRKKEDVQAPSPPPVTGHRASLAIQSEDRTNNGSSDRTSSDHPLTTSMVFTTIYDSLPQIHSTPSALAPSSQNTRSISPSYFAGGTDIASSSQMACPPWSFASSEPP